jgi:hypothetical protein
MAASFCPAAAMLTSSRAFSAPALLAGLGEAGAQVGHDVLQALPLAGSGAQGRAADADLTEMILNWDPSPSRRWA